MSDNDGCADQNRVFYKSSWIFNYVDLNPNFVSTEVYDDNLTDVRRCFEQVQEFFDVKKLYLRHFDPLEAALRKIDINGAGSIFVVDDHANIHGIISNEQLRESLRLGLSTEVHCGKVMKKDYFALRFDEIGKDVSEILEVYKVIPVVLDGRLIDVITSNNNDIIPISKPKFLVMQKSL